MTHRTLACLMCVMVMLGSSGVASAQAPTTTPAKKGSQCDWLKEATAPLRTESCRPINVSIKAEAGPGGFGCTWGIYLEWPHVRDAIGYEIHYRDFLGNPEGKPGKATPKREEGSGEDTPAGTHRAGLTGGSYGSLGGGPFPESCEVSGDVKRFKVEPSYAIIGRRQCAGKPVTKGKFVIEGTVANTASFPGFSSIDGKPVPEQGVNIKVTGPSSTTATTDAGGNYCAIVSKGKYVVKPNNGRVKYEPKQRSVSVSGDKAGIDFRRGAYFISGTAKDSSEKPVDDVSVRFVGPQGKAVKTGGGGKYWVRLPEGSYTVSAQKPMEGEDDFCSPSVGTGPGDCTKKFELAVPPERTINWILKPGPDFIADSLEINQGIQTDRSPKRAGTFPIPGFRSLGGEAYASTGGVPLVADRPAIVRLYGRFDPPGEEFQFAAEPKEADDPVGAKLYGFRGGSQLPGSPLDPIAPTTRTLTSASALPEHQTDPNGAFTFRIPASWAEGTVTLVGEVNPGEFPDSTERPVEECGDCLTNNPFALADIKFTEMPPLDITTLRGKYWVPSSSGTISSVLGPADPLPSFEGDYRALPVSLGGLRVRPYRSIFDLTPTFHRLSRFYPFIAPSQVKFDGYTLPDGRDAVHACASNSACVADFNSTVALEMVSAQARDGIPLLAMVLWNEPFGGLTPFTIRRSISLADSGQADAPIHETFHQLGFLHASSCGGGGGEKKDQAAPWPPDERGYIHGIGLDIGDSGPGTFLTPQNSYYDFMSYCGIGNETWFSTDNWTKAVRERFSGRASGSSGTPVPTAIAPIAVAALIRPDGITEIARVGAAGLNSFLTEPDTSSPYRIVVRDSKEAVVSETQAGSHVAVGQATEDKLVGGSGEFIVAVVPGDGAAKIQITKNGIQVAELARSANNPTVEVVAPKKGARVGSKGQTSVKWEAADADGDLLVATVDYSADDGKNWRTVGSGIVGKELELPADWFSISKQARVRVMVNDGFNQSSRTSERFEASGGGPEVRITSPVGRQVTAAGHNVDLAGTAFDDAGKAIEGKRLRWLEGKKLLGSGGFVSLVGLRSGKHSVELEARDQHGRIGRDSIVIVVEGEVGSTTTTATPSPASGGSESRPWLLSAVAAGLLVLAGALNVGIRVRQRSKRARAS